MKEIVNQILDLKPEHSRTNIILDFTLDRDYDRLEITCQYGPKKVDDMTLAKAWIEEVIAEQVPPECIDDWGKWEDFLPLWNFATFSLDYEGSYVGCAHRHSPDQTHLISELVSSPGFWKQKAAKGQWRAVINVHSISTAVVPYHIVITGKEAQE